eukprot:15479705-Alexandrium_andersonii.AAC.1
MPGAPTARAPGPPALRAENNPIIQTATALQTAEFKKRRNLIQIACSSNFGIPELLAQATPGFR